ncbi:MAG: phage tail tape measure protein [Lachnospiraceae bacterium]|nr:phage tail tape measure protein [Lachnospiraceae bacterium]
MASIQLATLEQELRLNTSQFDSAMSNASSLASGFTKAVGAACTGIIGLGTYSVSVGKSFESAMSQVAATMGMTSEEIAGGSEAYEKLKQAAIDAGSKTKYSATQAGEALNYLALAGYDVNKACEVMPQILNLAAAGGMDLARASDMVTDAMSALNIEANSQNVSKFSDQLAKASQKSNTSVSQLGDAILTVGGTAKNLAGGTTELSTCLGILADNGIKGAEGGTALRNMILALQSPTDKAAAAMEDLGIKVFDAQGNMRPMNGIFKDLDKTLSKMTQEEQTQILSTIFNKVDLKSANALLTNSGKRFDELSGYISNCDNACADMAETMSSNLQGGLDSLSSAAETFGIAIYDKLQKPLTELVGIGTESVRTLTEVFKNDGVNGLIQASGEMLAGFVSSGASYAPKLIQMGVSVIKSFVQGINTNASKIASSASSIITSLVNGAISLLPTILNLGINIITSLATGLSQQIPELIPMAVQAIISLVQGFTIGLPQIVQSGITLIQSLIQGIINAIPLLIEQAPKAINDFWNALDSQLPTLLKAGINMIQQIAQGIMQNIPLIIQNAGEIAKAIFNTLMHLDMLSLGKNLITNLGTGIKNMASGLVSAAKSTGESAFNAIKNINWLELGKTLITVMGNGIKAVASGLANIAKSAGTGALNAIKNINWLQLGKTLLTVIGNGVKSLATNFANITKSVGMGALNAIKNINWLQLGKTILTTIANGVKAVASALVNVLKSVGSSAANAIKNINWANVGHAILKVIANGVKAVASTLVNAMKSVGKSAMEAFKGINWTSIGKNIISGIINGIGGAAGSLFNKMRSIASSALESAKDALGIHSPSRKFAEVGKNVVLGIIQGIDKQKNTLGESAKDLSNIYLKSVKRIIEELKKANAITEEQEIDFWNEIKLKSEKGTSAYIEACKRLAEAKESAFDVDLSEDIDNESDGILQSMRHITDLLIEEGKAFINSYFKIGQEAGESLVRQSVDGLFRSTERLFNQFVNSADLKKIADVNYNLVNNITNDSDLKGMSGNKMITINMGDINISGAMTQDGAQHIGKIVLEKLNQFDQILMKELGFA